MSAQSTPGPCAGERPTVNATCCESDCGYCATTKVRDSHYCDLHTPCACAECQRARHAEQQYRAPDLAAENVALRKALARLESATTACLRNGVTLPAKLIDGLMSSTEQARAALTTHPARGEEGAQ